jgi:hypothetical protein
MVLIEGEGKEEENSELRQGSKSASDVLSA